MKTYGEVDVHVYIHVFLTSALAGDEWSASRPGRLTPRESHRYPLDRRVGGLQSRSGRREENSSAYRDSNSDPSVVQPVASGYTDYAIKAPSVMTLAKTYVKVQFIPSHQYEVVEVWLLHSCPRHYMDVWSASLPGQFTPEGRSPVPTAEVAGWAPEPVWTL
jgi:hypothetical protein